jgi:hypothetical protein
VPILVVVNNSKNWPLDIPGVEVVASRAYVTHPWYYTLRHGKVFNLCRFYCYQSLGYYLSWLPNRWYARRCGPPISSAYRDTWSRKHA